MTWLGPVAAAARRVRQAVAGLSHCRLRLTVDARRTRESMREY